MLRSLDERVFRMDGDTPVLLGSRCPRCEESFFPPRRLCAICSGPTDDTDLSGSGTLYSWTAVHTPWFGRAQMAAAGYGVGQVDLPEGVRVQSILAGEGGDWAIGMQMRIEHEVVEETDDGDQLCVYRFAPAAGASGA